ncbi:hypothetical protein HK096_002937 [Nowakowskiella sp. JEL0078]|nr:hypothetical protein HK096_002937 [Nowakowskiella sp. JEL0078]
MNPQMLSNFAQNPLVMVLSNQSPALFKVASAHPNLLLLLTNSSELLQQVLQSPQLIEYIIKFPDTIVSNPSILKQLLDHSSQRHAQLEFRQNMESKKKPLVNNNTLAVAPQQESSSSWPQERDTIRCAWLTVLGEAVGAEYISKNQEILLQLENTVFQMSPSKELYIKNLIGLNSSVLSVLPPGTLKLNALVNHSSLPLNPLAGLPANISSTNHSLQTTITAPNTKNIIYVSQPEQSKQFPISNNRFFVNSRNANINARSMNKPSPLKKFAGQEQILFDDENKNLFKLHTAELKILQNTLLQQYNQSPNISENISEYVKQLTEIIQDADNMIENDEYYFEVETIESAASKIISKLKLKSNNIHPSNNKIVDEVPRANEPATQTFTSEQIIVFLILKTSEWRFTKSFRN